MIPKMYGIKIATPSRRRGRGSMRAGSLMISTITRLQIDRARLGAWAAELGWEKVLNRAGTTFRKLPDADREGLDEDKAIALMLAQPSMIKRPVLDPGNRRVGICEGEWRAALAAEEALARRREIAERAASANGEYHEYETHLMLASLLHLGAASLGRAQRGEQCLIGRPHAGRAISGDAGRRCPRLQGANGGWPLAGEATGAETASSRDQVLRTETVSGTFTGWEMGDYLLGPCKGRRAAARRDQRPARADADRPLPRRQSRPSR